MKLTNLQIYNVAEKLNAAFTDNKQQLPAKINFAIQKNARLLGTLAKEIEDERIKVFEKYGDTHEDGNIYLREADKETALNELQDLLSLDQDVNILTVKIDSFTNNISLSLEQMNAIMFMIEED